jgi:hypothetical protein
LPVPDVVSADFRVEFVPVVIGRTRSTVRGAWKVARASSAALGERRIASIVQRLLERDAG